MHMQSTPAGAAMAIPIPTRNSILATHPDAFASRLAQSAIRS
jgi:hypothetical protein